MSDRLALESAIIDAEGAAAVHYVVEDALAGDLGRGWSELGLKPRKGIAVVVMTTEEQRAFLHAGDHLREAVAEVSRQFYAKPGEAA